VFKSSGLLVTYPANCKKTIITKGKTHVTFGKQENGIRKARCIGVSLITVVLGFIPSVALAQTIVPANDGTGTLVTTPSSPNQFDITDGTQSGTNLFHSFSQFDLNQGQIANFISNPTILNILTRINSNNPSYINGLIQVTNGNSNLFMMNPAGIVFGQGASLNVPGSFTATTATGISLGKDQLGNDLLFNATGSNNYAALVGTPSDLVFATSQPGAIVNSGQLSVGQDLSLVGGTVVSTGSVQASAGKINITTVPGQSMVRLDVPGQILSLEIPQSALTNSTLNPRTLPELLTGTQTTGVAVNSAGQVELTGSGLTVEPGDVAVRGNVTGQTASLLAQNNLSLVESQLQTTGDLNLLAKHAVQVRDTQTNPFAAQAGGNLAIQGNQSTNILALNRLSPERPPFISGGNFTISSPSIVFDSHVTSGGSVQFTGNTTSLFDPIITSSTDVSLSNYSGMALKIDAGGSITAGSITITGPDTTTIPLSDPDYEILTTTPSLIMRAGRSVNVGNINTSDQTSISAGHVRITAQGNITTGDITTRDLGDGNAGSVTLTSAGGNITVLNVDTSDQDAGNSGLITITAPAGNITHGELNWSNQGPGNQASNPVINAGGSIIIPPSTPSTPTPPSNGGGSTTPTPPSNGGGSTTPPSNGGGSTTPTPPSNGGGSTTPPSNGGGSTTPTPPSNGGGSTTPTPPSNGGGSTTPTPPSNGGGSTTPPSNGGGSTTPPSNGGGSTTPTPPSNGGGSTTPTPPSNGGGSTTPPSNGGGSTTPTPPSNGGGSTTPPSNGGGSTTPPSNGGGSTTPTPPSNGGGSTTPTPPSNGGGSTTPPSNGGGNTTPTPPSNGGGSTTPTPPSNGGGSTTNSSSGNTSTTNSSSSNASTSNSSSGNASTSNSSSGNASTSNSSNGNASASNSSSSSGSTNQSVSSRTTNSQDTDGTSYLSPVRSSTQPEVRDSSSGDEVSPNLVSSLEEPLTRQFEQYLGQPAQTRPVTLAETRNILRKVERATGVKPALIYVTFVPPTLTDNELRNVSAQSPDDLLELVLVTAEGEPIRRRVTGATREKVLPVVQQFQSEVTNAQSGRDYEAPSQQLYQWLMTPLETDIKARSIQNLSFIMDGGLRSLPIAALYDGQQFLVEKYSLGLMPSVTLTDTRFQSIRDLQVLAMGAEKFKERKPLPAVPVELSLITQSLWQGKSFLNEAFTIQNLKAQRQQKPFGLIHLATHASFRPGAPSNSYIEFWDAKLQLNQLSELRWHEPPVELLVLSACRTALGDRQAELGFAGFAVQAGVKSAIASLWSVSDEGTLALMTELYQQLKVSPIKAEGLRRAQIAMLKGEVLLKEGKLVTAKGAVPLPPELAKLGTVNLAHPYFWAGFTIVGSPW
jgi:filamentous hemagglutinin family protein